VTHRKGRHIAKFTSALHDVSSAAVTASVVAAQKACTGWRRKCILPVTDLQIQIPMCWDCDSVRHHLRAGHLAICSTSLRGGGDPTGKGRGEDGAGCSSHALHALAWMRWRQCAVPEHLTPWALAPRRPSRAPRRDGLHVRGVRPLENPRDAAGRRDVPRDDRGGRGRRLRVH
jgi:hypothetical protein